MNVKSIAEAVFEHITDMVRLLEPEEMASRGLQIVRGQSCVTRPLNFSDAKHWHLYPIVLADPEKYRGRSYFPSFMGFGVMYSGHGVDLSRDYPVPFDAILIQDGDGMYDSYTDALEAAEAIAGEVGRLGDMAIESSLDGRVLRALKDVGYKAAGQQVEPAVELVVAPADSDMVAVPRWVLGHLCEYAEPALQEECDNLGRAGHAASEHRASEIEAVETALRTYREGRPLPAELTGKQPQNSAVDALSESE